MLDFSEGIDNLMEKIKIKLQTPEELTEFFGMCNSYISDINVYDGHIVIDAKSIISIFSIPCGKTLTLQMISADDREIERFLAQISQFVIS